MSTSVLLRALEVQFRANLRSISNSLTEIAKLIEKNELANLPALESYLNGVCAELKVFYDVWVDLIEFVDADGKTDEEVKAQEGKLLVDYDKLHSQYRTYKAQYCKLNAKANEEKEKRACESLPNRRSEVFNASILLNNNKVKLPKVEIKKFLGNRKEFHD